MAFLFFKMINVFTAFLPKCIFNCTHFSFLLHSFSTIPFLPFFMSCLVPGVPHLSEPVGSFETLKQSPNGRCRRRSQPKCPRASFSINLIVPLQHFSQKLCWIECLLICTANQKAPGQKPRPLCKSLWRAAVKSVSGCSGARGHRVGDPCLKLHLLHYFLGTPLYYSVRDMPDIASIVLLNFVIRLAPQEEL